MKSLKPMKNLNLLFSTFPMCFEKPKSLMPVELSFLHRRFLITSPSLLQTIIELHAMPKPFK